MRENSTLLLQPSFYPICPYQDFSLAPSQSTFKGLEILISYANIVLLSIPSNYCCITSGPCLARLL